MSLADKIALDFQRIMDERKASEASRELSHKELRKALGVDHLDTVSLDANISLTTFAGDDEATIRGTRGKPPESLLDMAHPDPVFVAESDEEGGLVENLNEAHEKIMDVVNKIPSGFMYHGVMASTIERFTKLAQELDERGYHDIADELDSYCTAMLRTALDVPAPVDLPDVDVSSVMEIIDDAPDMPKGAPAAAAGAAAGVAGAAAAKGTAAAAGAVAGAASNAKKTGLIGRALAGLAGLFGFEGVGALAGAAATPAAIALGIAIAGGVIYKLWTGSLQQGLDEDLRDLQEEINDVRNVELSPRSNQLLDEMAGHATTMQALKAKADATKEDAAFVTIIDQLNQHIIDLKAAFTMFVSQAAGEDASFFRETMGFGFPSLENVIEDIEHSVADFVTAISSYYKLAARPAAASKTENSPENITNMSPELPTVPTQPLVSESDRIAGIQSFMREKVDESLPITGKIDRETIAAIEKFTERISKDIGVSNLTASRVAETGSEKTLRRIWDVYVNADRLLAADARK